jgi:hypothetical protein
MSSPMDFSPKGKAASIRSFDSGYASGTLEDDEPSKVRIEKLLVRTCQAAAYVFQSPTRPSASTPQTNTRHAEQPVGLGISGYCSVRVEDQLHLRRSEIPIGPVTTKLNVFTTLATLSNDQSPQICENSTATCIECQLWDITNPGAGLRCDDCRSKNYISPAELTLFDPKTNVKLPEPHIDIARQAQPKSFKRYSNKGRCTACDLARVIDPTTSSGCPTCIAESDLSSLISPIQWTVKRSCARRPAKLPPYALHHLRAWIRANRDDPYPGSETKRFLAYECGITEKQVTTWFTNTRARKMPLPSNPSRPNSEDEGPDESDYSSIANTSICTSEVTFTHVPYSNRQPTSSGTGPSSQNASQLNLQTSRRGKKKDYRRIATVSPVEDSPVPHNSATPSPNEEATEQEMWQCTYCPQKLVPKSWRRHEETQHRPKHQWTCLSTGPRLTIPTRNGTSSICVFCQVRNPSDDHFLNSHRILECSKKSEADRTFGRPDHLRQHVKNFHKTSLLDLVREKWRKDGPGKNLNETWLCGFCAVELKTWDVRETHIANHFKDGMTMASWTDYSTPPSAIVKNGRSRRPRDQPTGLLAKLKETFTGKADRQPQTSFAIAFEPVPTSMPCSSVVAPPLLPEFSDLMFDACMPDALAAEFEFNAVSSELFDTSFTGACDMYVPFQGDETAHGDFDAMLRLGQWGGFGDYQDGWNMNQQ